MKVAVIGAGIVGVATAYELALRGAGVTLIEAHEGAGGGVVDAYGHKLASANNIPGGGRTKWHDEIKWIIDSWGRQLGISITTEVYGLFAALINQSPELNGLPARKRQGMVPDFMMTLAANIRSLAELKTIAQCPTRFTPTAIRTRCGAVAKRARDLLKEGPKKAREIDIRYNGLDKDDPGMGPVQARFASFGRLQCFVVGPRGEISSDLESFIGRLSEVGAERMWKTMGARSIKEAKAVIKVRLIRTIGITGFRGYARLVMDRLGTVVGDGKKAAERRAKARSAGMEWRDEYDRRAGPIGMGGFKNS